MSRDSITGMDTLITFNLNDIRMIWFTSDTHFGHQAIINMVDRPFISIDEMNRKLVNNINSKVRANDHLYHLGDFSYRTSVEEALNIRKQIKCKNVHLIKGNHDKDWSNSEVQGTFIIEPLVTTIKLQDGKKLALCHYPMLGWPSKHHGSIHLHGHIHAKHDYNLKNRERCVLRYDVGVDANNFAPVSLDEVLEFFENVDFTQTSTENQF